MPIWLFKGMRLDTGPLGGDGALLPVVHVVLLEGTRGAEPPYGPKRMISLISAGEALSQKAQAVTSTLSGPLGCHTRKVRDPARSMEKLGKMVAAKGLSRSRRGPKRSLISCLTSASYWTRAGMGGLGSSSGPKQIMWAGPAATMDPPVWGSMALLLAKEFLIAER